MTSIFKLHDIVLQVSIEAKKLIKPKQVIDDENNLLFELVFCILSSQEKFEVALGATKSLENNGALRTPRNKSDIRKIQRQIEEILSEPVMFRAQGKHQKRRLRFYVNKSRYLGTTIENIYSNSRNLTEVLSCSSSIYEAREKVIKISSGVGPKQASMFLRNAGYCDDFAILDKHVIEYMKIMTLIGPSNYNFSQLSTYEQVEGRLKSYASTYNIELLYLDLGIWATMRTLKHYRYE